MNNSLRARYSFRHGEVHDADNRIARYVTRLSMALGDLRIAAHYATRKGQNAAERLYFVRLTASHLREVLLIMDPPNAQTVPTVEEFLASLPWGTKPSRTEIRKSHRRALRLVDKPMAKGRPEISTDKGTKRRPKLRDDLKELRDRFFHYGHDQTGDDAIRAAMASLNLWNSSNRSRCSSTKWRLPGLTAIATLSQSACRAGDREHWPNSRANNRPGQPQTLAKEGRRPVRQIG